MPPLVERNEKPIIGIVDGGQLYDAMCAGLMDRGVCVFRNCARGTRALVRYVEARLYADALRDRLTHAARSIRAADAPSSSAIIPTTHREDPP